MKYNEELDCWIVFWGDNTGYKVRCGDWFDLHLGGWKEAVMPHGTRKGMVYYRWSE